MKIDILLDRKQREPNYLKHADPLHILPDCLETLKHLRFMLQNSRIEYSRGSLFGIQF